MKETTIKNCRIAAGLTQKQFSELFNPPIPLDTIKKWDSGKMQPPDWVEGMIIEKLERIKEGNMKVDLTQEDISKIMTALTVAKMGAKDDIMTAKSQEEKELRESTAKEWEDAQWEIGLKLGYYTEPEEVLQRENSEDLMMELLKD